MPVEGTGDLWKVRVNSGVLSGRSRGMKVSIGSIFLKLYLSNSERVVKYLGQN